MGKDIVYIEPADYFTKEIRKKYKLGEYADGDRKLTRDDIQRVHALMDYDHEIEYCNKVLSSDADESEKQYIRKRLEKA